MLNATDPLPEFSLLIDTIFICCLFTSILFVRIAVGNLTTCGRLSWGQATGIAEPWARTAPAFTRLWELQVSRAVAIIPF